MTKKKIIVDVVKRKGCGHPSVPKAKEVSECEQYKRKDYYRQSDRNGNHWTEITYVIFHLLF